MIDVYSYIRQREPGNAGITFFHFARRLYTRRALLLLLALPIDAVWMMLLAITRLVLPRRHAAILLLTSVQPGFLELLDDRRLIWVGAPHHGWRFIKQGSGYIPGSWLYVLVSIGLYLPTTWQRGLGEIAVALFRCQLRLARISGGTVVHHSDALPFARAIVLAAREQSLTTVCIQHGLFHAGAQIRERDGCLSNINVVRSSLDADLIRTAAPESIYLEEPDFFLPAEIASVSRRPRHVTLLGEGWFQCDDLFDAQYLGRLQRLEAALVKLNCEVVFRPHPCERGKAADMGFRQLDLGSLEECLARTSLVIGFSSTVLHEAASLGIRSAQIDVEGAFNPSMERDGSQIFKVRSADEAVALLGIDLNAVAQADDSFNARRTRAAQRVLKSMESFPGRDQA